MLNVLLDHLPEDWHGFPIDSSYRTGILISQALSDPELNKKERLDISLSLLFPDESNRPGYQEAVEGLSWFLNGYSHDNHTPPKQSAQVMDFDIDQWRIYAAFLSQYRIDLNTVRMHWWVFMGLLTSLEECTFTRVIDIRTKTIEPKMSSGEKKAIAAAKKVYGLSMQEQSLSPVEKERDTAAVEEFKKLMQGKQ